MKKRKSEMPFWKDISFYLLLILVLLTVGLLGQIFMLQILPNKYTIPIAVILLILCLLMYLLQYSKRVNKFNRVLGKIIIVVLIIAIGAGNYYVYKGSQTLSEISGVTIKTDAISVIVMADKDVEKEDFDTMKQFTYGILSNIDAENTDKAVTELNEKMETTIQTQSYASPFELAEALYSGNVDAVLLNEAYRGIFQDNEDNKKFVNFDTDTKVIYQVEIESEIDDISKNVDVTKTPFSVFISGIDTYGPVSTLSRSDVNMLATVNPQTHQILLTSIPRDYYVPQTCQGGQMDKLTHAGIFGVECSVSSMENLFGIDINYYVRVNFSSLIDIVNALGGVTVDNPLAFNTYLYSFPAGPITLNGDEALAFSRERYSLAGGDRDRGKNQMRVITGIINKAISPSIITNYTGVMNAISGSFQTNMESDEITKFIQKQLETMSGWTIVQNSVDGSGGTDWTPANGFNAYVMYPDQASVDRAKTWINQVMNGQEIVQ